MLARAALLPHIRPGIDWDRVRRFPPLFAALLAFATWSAVFAHAEPARVTPGDGAILTSPPAQVQIEMSQELARQAGGNAIHVFDASGKEVTTVAAVIDNADRRRLKVPLPSNLPSGAYTVKWKSLSAEDGDTAEGTLRFTFDPNGVANPGKTVLREDLLGTGEPNGATPVPAAPSTGGGDGGVSWVLVVAVAVGALVLGSGTTFLLVQRRT